jgi:hypothetical protein
VDVPSKKQNIEVRRYWKRASEIRTMLSHLMMKVRRNLDIHSSVLRGRFAANSCAFRLRVLPSSFSSDSICVSLEQRDQTTQTTTTPRNMPRRCIRKRATYQYPPMKSMFGTKTSS